MGIIEITLEFSDPYWELHRTMIIDVNTIVRIQLGEIQVHILGCKTSMHTKKKGPH
jgi:hypothetical protein